MSEVEAEKGVLTRSYFRCSISVLAVLAAFLLRQALVQYLGAELPPFIFFYPTVMAVALLAGFWPGILASALASLTAQYWIFKPIGQFAIANKSDAIALGFFFAMGVFMSVVAERYRRYHQRTAALERVQALRESEETLRQMSEFRRLALDAAELGAWDYRFETGELLWDRRCRSMFGIEAAERVSYATILTCIHSEDRAAFTAEIQRAVSGDESGFYSREFRVVWPDGSTHWLSSQGRVYFDNSHDKQRAIGLLGMNTDITERKCAEETLRDKEALLQEVGRMAKVGGWEFDPVTGKGSMTDEVARIHDLDPEFHITSEMGKTFYLGKSRIQIEEALQRAVEQAIPYDLELEFVTAKGVHRWVRTICHPVVDNGKVVKMRGSFQDITELKEAEQTLQEKEERWATTLRSIGDAVISTNAAGNIEFINDAAQLLTGWTLEEAQGKELSEVFNIIQEGTRNIPESPVAKVFRSGKVVALANHTLLIRRDGSEIPIDDSAAPIRNSEGGVSGVVLVFHDVSEQRNAEKALRNSDRLATTGRLAATIAHEIHNPLDAIAGLLHLIELDTQEGSTREFVTMASQELIRITQMTQQMLSFQREAARPIPVKISEVLDSVIGLYERKVKSTQIRVEQHVDADLEILALPGELRQMFANLIGNSIEALGQRPGTIALRAYSSRHWRNGRPGLRVVVADNGPGIPIDVRAKIFEPFFTTKGEGGTGLGLWVTSDILRKYKATMHLRSSITPNRSGTCFSVFLPNDHHGEAA